MYPWDFCLPHMRHFCLPLPWDFSLPFPLLPTTTLRAPRIILKHPEPHQAWRQRPSSSRPLRRIVLDRDRVLGIGFHFPHSPGGEFNIVMKSHPSLADNTTSSLGRYQDRSIADKDAPSRLSDRCAAPHRPEIDRTSPRGWERSRKLFGRRVGIHQELLGGGLRRRGALGDKGRLQVGDDPVHDGVLREKGNDAPVITATLPIFIFLSVCDVER